MAKIILDFDGVLFDSAYEAYCVCEKAAELSESLRMRHDVSYTEFRFHRPSVKNAQDFIPLYYSNSDSTAVDIPTFLECFFNARTVLMQEDDYSVKYFPRCQFLDMILPYMQNDTSCFHILSTRDTTSIDMAMKQNGVSMTDRIIGQDSIRKYGSKINALKAKGIEQCDLYIDDMRHYVDELKPISYLSLMANWGYGMKDKDSLSTLVMTDILKYIYLRK